MPDLSNDEISVQGEYYRCEACGIESHDADLFDIDTDTDLTSTGAYATVCAFGYGCQTEATTLGRGPGAVVAFAIGAAAIARCPTRNLTVSHWRPDGTCLHSPPTGEARTLPERDADEAYEDAVDAALERGDA